MAKISGKVFKIERYKKVGDLSYVRFGKYSIAYFIIKETTGFSFKVGQTKKFRLVEVK